MDPRGRTLYTEGTASAQALKWECAGQSGKQEAHISGKE